MEEGRRGRSGIWVCLSEQIGASDGLGVGVLDVRRRWVYNIGYVGFGICKRVC